MEISHIYNPDNQSEDELIKSFVIRIKEYQDIIHDIERDQMEHPPQHYIIQGQRGTGKTTLLLRIYYELKNNKILKEKHLPVKFSEEQYNIRTLFKLWEELAIQLEAEDSLFYGLTSEIERVDESNLIKYEEILYEIIESKIKKSKRNIVLLIDNIGVLFKKFSKRDQQRLREILMTNNNIRIIGASAYVLEATDDYLKPFYEFFKVISLKELTSKETKELLLTLDEKYQIGTIPEIIKNHPARIEALRRIAGGVPRTMVLLFEIFVDDENGNAIKDLEVILDKVTPLYQHRMDDLPGHQQEIAHHLALAWDAMSVGEIAKVVKMDSNKISAQLLQMRKNGFVTKITTKTKNHLYQISERFFNIWYLMRHGRKKERDKVKWLIRFLEIWCSSEELTKRTVQHIKNMQCKDSKMYEKYAYYLSEALAFLPINSDLQHKLLSETKKYLTKSKSKLINELSLSDLSIRNSIKEMIEKEADVNKVLEGLIDIKHKNEDEYLLIGYYYEEKFKDYQKAEKYYKLAAEKGLLGAMNNLAWQYFQKGINGEKAFELSKNAYSINPSLENAHTYALILLWIDEIPEAMEVSKVFLENENAYEKYTNEIILFLLMLMAKKQYATVNKIFNKNQNNLKERFKPLYYAFIKLTEDKSSTEFRRMGAELKESVDEIVDRIEKMRKDYT